MKKIFGFIMLIALFITLSGCWNGEISVETEINSDGSGTRTIVLEVMDDTLSDDPIVNPDDPNQEKGKGAVINDKHIIGGLPAIQTWLEDNAPSWMTVEEMTVDGYYRYYTLTYDFENFEDFIAKYKELVDLSPTLSWNDFDATEKPSWECEGTFQKECTFTESKAMVDASLDWAIDGIWTNIYDAADLEGYVTKANIAVLADYKLTVGDTTVEELHNFDEDAQDGEYTGKVIYVQSEGFEATDTFTNTKLIIGVIAAAVVVVGAGAFIILKVTKKK